MASNFGSKDGWLKKNKQLWPILAGIAVVFVLWVGGIIVQATAGDFLLGKQNIRFDPISCIAANFTKGVHGVIFVLMAIACLGAYFYIRYKDKHRLDTEVDERGFQREKSGVYGTAALLKENEIKDFCEVEPLERTLGMIIGKYIEESNPSSTNKVISIPPDGKRFKYDGLGRLAIHTDEKTGKREPMRVRLKTNGNRHMMVLGASGSGKSYCFARPAIFQSIRRGESIIVTDPKGELFSDTAKYAEANGYTVKILNLAYPQGSDSWDCLAEVRGGQIGIEAQNFCNIIISNTSNPNASADEVYANGEKNLLTALVLYVLTSPHYTGPKTLGGVYDVLCKSEEDLEAAFSMLPENNIALGPWSIFKTASSALRGNLKLGLGVRLQVLQDEIIKCVTGTPDIDLTLPGKSKCAYYVIMSDMNTTFQFISSLFFTCLFNRLVEYSRMQPDQVLPISVNVIMDEFIAIGKLPDFDKKLATVRSAHINIAMIFQNLPQLQESYPDGLWETLIGNCYTLLCLSCNDMTTATYLSERSGIATVALENLRVDRPTIQIANVPSQVSHTYSVGQRAVLQPAEVMTLSAENKVLVTLAGADLFVADKFPYTDMIDPRILEKVNMYEHSPSWVLQAQYIPSYDYEPQAQAEVQTTYERKQRWEDNTQSAKSPAEDPDLDAAAEFGQDMDTPAAPAQSQVKDPPPFDMDGDFDDADEQAEEKEDAKEEKRPQKKRGKGQKAPAKPKSHAVTDSSNDINFF